MPWVAELGRSTRWRHSMRRFCTLALLACLLFGLSALGAERAGQRVTVHFKGGGRISATLVAEEADSVTLSTGEGTVRFPRSMIERIEGGGVRPPAKSGTEGPKSTEVPSPPKPGQWSEAEEAKIEECLTRYFTAKDDAGRKAALAELEKTRLDRHVEDLEHMRGLAGKGKGLQRHLPVPWRKGADRGWYNLAVPGDYTPAKAWPLVLALHGMPSDGDNLVSWYSGYFPPRGYIVLFPTTIHRSSFWPAPGEKLELLRLVRSIARSYRVDYKRIYCTGASGGGIGTWHWLVTLPDLFAAGISVSAAGTIFDKRLEKLKGIPFYVHHGTSDPIPIQSVEQSIAAARRFGADKIEFYASKGTGHTPPAGDWNRAFEWLVKQPPKGRSARHLLEAPEGALPVGYPRCLPFSVEPEPDALAKLRASYRDRASSWRFPDTLAPDDLLGGLIAIAKALDPAVQPEAVRGEVKRLADAVRKTAKPGAPPADLLYALNELFFQTEGFSRDGADPTGDSPDGYAVHRVLKDHRGSVFTLAGLYVAVANDLGLPVGPVASPYHAFARFDDGKEQVNIEMTESGGHFDDKVYGDGYGLARLPSGAASRARGVSALLAAHLAALGGMAGAAGQRETAAAAARAALALDPSCFGAILLQASAAAADAKGAQEALRLLQRAAGAWPDYAAPRLLQGELLARSGSARQAVDAYAKGIDARLKPYGAAAAFDAELYYRIAAIYAPLAREALSAQRVAAVTYMNKFNAAILNALKNDPNHPGARKLLAEMGGSIR